MTVVLRWFGVLRKKNNHIVFASSPTSVVPDQDVFLSFTLKKEERDVVVELLQSSIWQPKDFNYYCSATYLKKGKDAEDSPERL